MLCCVCGDWLTSSKVAAIDSCLRQSAMRVAISIVSASWIKTWDRSSGYISGSWGTLAGFQVLGLLRNTGADFCIKCKPRGAGTAGEADRISTDLITGISGAISLLFEVDMVVCCCCLLSFFVMRNIIRSCWWFYCSVRVGGFSFCVQQAT